MQPCWKSKTPRKKGMGRMPLWENDNAYAHLGDRHSRCDARECLCPQGREHREGRGFANLEVHDLKQEDSMKMRKEDRKWLAESRWTRNKR
nr:uncharacterized protein LOC110363568 isoform X3 [Columba livia]